MPDDATMPASIGAFRSHIAVENEILELFAPVHKYHDDIPTPGRNDKVSLWRADAIHRAKNLAQLTLSLATLAEHASRCWLPSGLVVQTRCLARAYDELGREASHAAAVPCAPLLSEIATRLVLIFGAARQIEVIVTAAPVMLGADARRALVLMCSEMVINALKYAFPGPGGGRIHVILSIDHGRIALIVEDDGVGHAPGSPGGNGHRLIAELGAQCDASVRHGPGADGVGYRVDVELPPMAAVARQA